MWVEAKNETERQTDILHISSLPFFPFSFSIHILISPRIHHRDFMVPSLFLLPFCSLLVCFYWFGLWKLGSFITCLKASIFLLCRHQGCNIIHKHSQHPPPHPFPSPSVLCAPLTLPKHKRVEWMTAWPQLLSSSCHFYLYSPAPIYYWNADHFFSSRVSKACKSGREPYDSVPSFIW